MILNGCGSTTKKLQQGNYDAVIDKTVKKLIKKPNADDAAEMDRAYRLANERDHGADQVTWLQKIIRTIMMRYLTGTTC